MNLTPNGLIMLRKSAEKGNQYAQYDLGVMYAFGDNGVPKDETKAAEWYQKAAMQGNKYAQFGLGVMYEFGRGVSKDEAKAAEWYQKAAAQGWSGGSKKSVSNKENPDNDKKPNSNAPPSGTDALLSVVAIVAVFLLAAFLGANYNNEVFKFINAALVIGLVYALIKHTRRTLVIMVLIGIISVTGSVMKVVQAEAVMSMSQALVFADDLLPKLVRNQHRVCG